MAQLLWGEAARRSSRLPKELTGQGCSVGGGVVVVCVSSLRPALGCLTQPTKLPPGRFLGEKTVRSAILWISRESGPFRPPGGRFSSEDTGGLRRRWIVALRLRGRELWGGHRQLWGNWAEREVRLLGDGGEVGFGPSLLRPEGLLTPLRNSLGTPAHQGPRKQAVGPEREGAVPGGAEGRRQPPAPP